MFIDKALKHQNYYKSLGSKIHRRFKNRPEKEDSFYPETEACNHLLKEVDKVMDKVKSKNEESEKYAKSIRHRHAKAFPAIVAAAWDKAKEADKGKGAKGKGYLSIMPSAGGTERR